MEGVTPKETRRRHSVASKAFFRFFNQRPAPGEPIIIHVRTRRLKAEPERAVSTIYGCSDEYNLDLKVFGQSGTVNIANALRPNAPRLAGGYSEMLVPNQRSFRVVLTVLLSLDQPDMVKKLLLILPL